MIQWRALLTAVVAALWVGLLPAAESHRAREQIVAAEQERCEAITHGDAHKLGELLAEDYVHIHGTGKVDSKAGFIANIVEHPRRTERGELTVRVYGQIAVVTGEQYNYLPSAAEPTTPVRTTNYVTQVVRYSDGRWQFISFQLTPIPAANSQAVTPQSTVPLDRASYFSNANLQDIWKDLENRQVMNKRVLEGGKFSVNIRIVRPTDPPLVHAKSVDLWVVTQGTAVAVTGGTLVDQRQGGQTDDLAGSSIKDGVDQPLTVGDMVFVPPGVPHAFKNMKNFRAVLIRWDLK